MTRDLTTRAVLLLSIGGVLAATMLPAIGTHTREATVGLCIVGGLLLFVAVAYAAAMGLLHGLDRLRARMRSSITARAVVLLTAFGMAMATLLATTAACAIRPPDEQPITRIDPVLKHLINGTGYLGDPYLGLK